MKYIYISMVALALYGDLLKRFLPPQAALATLYILAVLLLVVLILNKYPTTVSCIETLEASALRCLAIIIIITYIFLALISAADDWSSGLMESIYISIPLLYLIVIGRYVPSFNLRDMAVPFLWLMIPINVVGIIQYTYDPRFLVSSTYSEDGGVILRNLLGGDLGTFERYPSLFASADRYSAMGLMHLFFVIAFIKKIDQYYIRNFSWLAFNIASAFVALAVAGARSRILIVLLIGVVVLFALAVKTNYKSGFRRLKGYWIAVFSVILALLTIFIVNLKVIESLISSVAIVSMLQNTFLTGDILVRLAQAMGQSMLPDSNLLIGKGLGTESPGGRPGEFALRVFWLESGLVGGGLLLSCFALFLIFLGRLTFLSYQRGEVFEFMLNAIPFALMLFALLTGLTGVFELSTGLLLFSAIAVNSRHHVQNSV